MFSTLVISSKVLTQLSVLQTVGTQIFTKGLNKQEQEALRLKFSDKNSEGTTPIGITCRGLIHCT